MTVGQGSPAPASAPLVTPAGDTPPGFLPALGERVITIGQTGSGKTTLALKLLQRFPESPFIIYDTKEEPKFETLQNSVVVTKDNELYGALSDESIDYVIYRPSIYLLTDPELLDKLLERHYYDFPNTGAYIDELYQFHNNSQPGPGLVALYTRGRSRGITTIASTQRPKRISLFSLSEAQLFYIFRLNHADDRKAISKASGMPEMPNPPPHYFYVYRAGDETCRLCKPVKVDGLQSFAYTDSPPIDEGAQATDEIGHVWL
jgi:energy-coupling factor transporter ATP-binding protein EcfA2